LEPCSRGRPVSTPIAASMIVSALTAAVLASMEKELAYSVIIVSLLGYLALSLLDVSWRLPLLASALAAHATSVALYYSNPIPLPLLILERGAQGYTLNIDIVQVALLAEASTLLSRMSVPCEEQPGEGGSGGYGESQPQEAQEGSGEDRHPHDAGEDKGGDQGNGASGESASHPQ